jgi:hypothetical protein
MGLELFEIPPVLCSNKGTRGSLCHGIKGYWYLFNTNLNVSICLVHSNSLRTTTSGSSLAGSGTRAGLLLKITQIWPHPDFNSQTLQQQQKTIKLLGGQTVSWLVRSLRVTLPLPVLGSKTTNRLLPEYLIFLPLVITHFLISCFLRVRYHIHTIMHCKMVSIVSLSTIIPWTHILPRFKSEPCRFRYPLEWVVSPLTVTVTSVPWLFPPSPQAMWVSISVELSSTAGKLR